MANRLVVTAGPEAGKEFALDEGQTLVIGRGQASDTQIDDPSMSRVHCEIRCSNGLVTIADRGSSSGTFVNGQKVEEQPLQPGATIQLGNSKFTLAGDTREDATLVGSPSPRATPLPDLVGHKLAHYQLEKIITKGQSGMVFMAIDTEKQRTVAVKVLSPDYASTDEQKQRFIRAMKTVMPIRHENIVQLYNAGKQGPYCWAAMEYVEGDSLAHVIDEIGVAGMLPWQEAFRVAIHMSRALMAAAEQKMIHRNVTPQNILRRASDKVTKLADLMQAKALEGALSKTVTQPGQIIGDLPYMSPERTGADTVDVDVTSDIYELGATLYALVTGRPPFEASSFPELVTKVREEPPMKPKEIHLGVPDQFQDAIMTMLEKRPKDRFKSAAELQKALHRIGMLNGINPDSL